MPHNSAYRWNHCKNVTWDAIMFTSQFFINRENIQQLLHTKINKNNEKPALYVFLKKEPTARQTRSQWHPFHDVTNTYSVRYEHQSSLLQCVEISKHFYSSLYVSLVNNFTQNTSKSNTWFPQIMTYLFQGLFKDFWGTFSRTFQGLFFVLSNIHSQKMIKNGLFK